jgi:hypothetical protein
LGRYDEQGNYLVRYVCANRNNKPRKETCHKLSHLATATGDRDVIQWFKTRKMNIG